MSIERNVFSFLFKHNLVESLLKAFFRKKMASKVFPYLVCVFALLSLFSLECDAFGNGAIPGKRSFKEKNSKRVSRVNVRASLLIYFLVDVRAKTILNIV